MATAQYLTDIARTLSGRGHEVHVLAGRRGYASPHPLYPAGETLDGIRVHRCWPFAWGRSRRLFRVAEAVCINLAFAVRLLFLGKYDCLVVLTSPPLIAFFTVLIARLRGQKVVHWMMDLNPDEAIEAGWVARGSVRARVLRAALRYVLRHSDELVVLDRFMRERIICEGAEAEKITVIPPWSHQGDIQAVPHEQNPFRSENGWQEKFVVMYSGNHSVCHPLDTLLGAALLLRDDTKIHFVFIGGGERVKEVAEFKKRYCLENIEQLSYLPREELTFSLSAADTHVIVMGNPFVGIVHPSKIYDILNLGRPFVYIGPDPGHVTEIIEKSGEGWVVAHGETQKLAELLAAGSRKPPGDFRQSRVLAQNVFAREGLEAEFVKLVETGRSGSREEVS